MKFSPWMTCLMATLLIAATANAQPGGGGRGRGGGMLGRGNIFMTVSNEAVQKELGLSTDNTEKVKSLVEEFNSTAREAMRDAGGGNFQDLSAEERTKLFEKLSEANKSTTEKYLPKLKDALTADQFARLQQVNWQAMGAAALSDAEVIKSLSITSEQQEKIKSITADYVGKMRELRGGGGGGFEKMMELNKERDGKITDLLTKEQADKFASIKGKEFDLEQLRQGRPGRGGGAGGGGIGGGGGRPKRPQPKAE